MMRRWGWRRNQRGGRMAGRRMRCTTWLRLQGVVSQGRTGSTGAGFPKERGLKAIKVGAKMSRWRERNLVLRKLILPIYMAMLRAPQRRRDRHSQRRRWRPGETRRCNDKIFSGKQNRARADAALIEGFCGMDWREVEERAVERAGKVVETGLQCPRQKGTRQWTRTGQHQRRIREHQVPLAGPRNRQLGSWPSASHRCRTQDRALANPASC